MMALSRTDSPGDPSRWWEAIRKLGAGESVNILVLGGSETAGVECQEDRGSKRKLRECAWPARVGDWLRHSFPDATINVDNLGRGATTTRVMLAALANVFQQRVQHPDMILTDFCINDSYEERSRAGTKTKAETIEL
eukprot:SAG31_NODE_17227_length_678_cov_2.303972_2_plen_136_part_01